MAVAASLGCDPKDVQVSFLLFVVLVLALLASHAFILLSFTYLLPCIFTHSVNYLLTYSDVGIS